MRRNSLGILMATIISFLVWLPQNDASAQTTAIDVLLSENQQILHKLDSIKGEIMLLQNQLDEKNEIIKQRVSDSPSVAKTMERDTIMLMNDKIELTIKRKFDKDDDEEEEDEDKPLAIEVTPSFGFGTNILVNSNGEIATVANDGLELRVGRSTHFAFGIGVSIPLGANEKTSISIGPELIFNKYSFSQDSPLLPGQDPDGLVTNLAFNSNRLRTVSFQLPIAFNVHVPIKSLKNQPTFNIGMGGYVGVVAGAKTRLHTDELGAIRMKDDFDLNRFEYGIENYIGIGWFNIFTKFSFADMFNSTAGIDVNNLTVGIKLMSKR